MKTQNNFLLFNKIISVVTNAAIDSLAPTIPTVFGNRFILNKSLSSALFSESNIKYILIYTPNKDSIYFSCPAINSYLNYKISISVNLQQNDYVFSIIKEDTSETIYENKVTNPNDLLDTYYKWLSSVGFEQNLQPTGTHNK